MPSIFSSLLGSLGTYVPKSFVLASFIPTLTFVVLNLAALIVLSAQMHDLFLLRYGLLTAGFYYSVILVGIAIVAYFLSTAVTYLREVLEGRHLWPRFLLEQKRAEQGARAQGLETARLTALAARTGVQASKPDWIKTLATARDAGAVASPKNATYGTQSPSYRIVERIRRRITGSDEVTAASMDDAVTALSTVLSANDSDAPNASGVLLQQHYRALLAASDYAIDFYARAEAVAFHRRQFEFGEDTIAPTRIGNIAATMQGYAQTRYGMDLDFFWGRIQAVAVKDATYADALINAKTQLDFLVLSFWLATASTAAWTVILALYGYSPGQFLVVAGIGVGLMFVSYELLALSYYGFADVVRVTIDFYRLELLKALHVPLPRSTTEERALWKRLVLIAAYGQAELDMTYAQ